MRYLLMLLLLTMTAYAHGDSLNTVSADQVPGKEWDNFDKGLMAANVALNVMDMLQTLDIKNHPATPYHTEMIEMNPILGHHPSDAAIIGFKVGVIGLTYMFADYLPSPARKLFLAVSTMLILKSVDGNHQLGLKMQFR